MQCGGRESWESNEKLHFLPSAANVCFVCKLILNLDLFVSIAHTLPDSHAYYYIPFIQIAQFLVDD